MRFSHFVRGLPVFSVIPAPSWLVTTEVMNVLAPAAVATQYANRCPDLGAVTYELPMPDPTQWIDISNGAGFANPLTVQAPVGTSLRWLDGNLYNSVSSAGSLTNNLTVVGESGHNLARDFCGAGR